MVLAQTMTTKANKHVFSLINQIGIRVVGIVRDFTWINPPKLNVSKTMKDSYDFEDNIQKITMIMHFSLIKSADLTT